MLGSAEGQSEPGGLVALPGETRDTILVLNPKYGDQRHKVFNFTLSFTFLSLILSFNIIVMSRLNKI